MQFFRDQIEELRRLGVALERCAARLVAANDRSVAVFIHRLFAHLVTADGGLSAEELRLLAGYYHDTFSWNDEVEFARETVASSPRFLTTVPAFLVRAIALDVEKHSANAARMVQIIAEMGEIVVNIDGVIDPRERRSLDQLLGTCREALALIPRFEHPASDGAVTIEASEHTMLDVSARDASIALEDYDPRQVSSPGLTAIGNTSPACPYCGAPFSKFPQRKTMCTACRNFAYSRTRPLDGLKALFRDEDLDLLDEQWAVANGTHDQFLIERTRRRNIRAELAKQIEREPTEVEFQCCLLEADTAAQAARENWALYRNSRFAMAELLRKQRRVHEALSIYLEVCYLDLSGPQNYGGMYVSPEARISFPAFDEKYAMIAPGILRRCASATEDLALDSVAVRAAFFAAAATVDRQIRLPVDATAAWDMLRKELYPA